MKLKLLPLLLLAQPACTDTTPYRSFGTDTLDQEYYLDTDSKSVTMPIAGDAIRLATVIVRKNSGYSDAVHVSVTCDEKRWRQGYFANDDRETKIIPQNMSPTSTEPPSADHPMWQIVEHVCANQ